MFEDRLTKAYYKKELHAFLINDAVIRVPRPKILGELQGPVSPPAAGSSKLSAAKALMRLLKETGIIAESFEAETLFDLKLSEKQPTLSKSTTTRSTLIPARSTPIVAPDDETAASLPYVSATEEVESSDSEEPPRMTLGPAGVAMLQDRAKHGTRLTPINPRATLEAMVNSDRHPPEKPELFFQAAMERFLKEQQVPQKRPKPISTGDQDVEMESVRSPDQPITAWEYDPDDLDLGRPARATVATTTTITSGQATNVPRIRVSAMPELKEFSGKDGDEDRARSWLGKMTSTFIRDQAPDQIKCLLFGDLLTGPARNWYHQLSRTTRIRAVQVPGDSSDSDEESRSSSDEGLRRVYLASTSQQDNPQDQRIPDQAKGSYQQDHHINRYPRPTDEGTSSKRCSHGGSRRHDDLGC
ncbi:unnamed protein product [Phytophthora fragariaefolia]|uniref:Unnamed protein product n=1 Tax=Phytophthora fragariaefolia TaxID=1490495 RepID=A0A9W6WU33_9STRA|nr:unnamed protein product [Phytophthora fragariaefolia]